MFLDMLNNHVHYYHLYAAMIELYKHNVWPVVTENLVHNGVTNPPFVKTAKGRPRVKRI